MDRFSHVVLLQQHACRKYAGYSSIHSVIPTPIISQPAAHVTPCSQPLCHPRSSHLRSRRCTPHHLPWRRRRRPRRRQFLRRPRRRSASAEPRTRRRWPWRRWRRPRRRQCLRRPRSPSAPAQVPQSWRLLLLSLRSECGAKLNWDRVRLYRTRRFVVQSRKRFLHCLHLHALSLGQMNPFADEASASEFAERWSVYTGVKFKAAVGSQMIRCEWFARTFSESGLPGEPLCSMGCRPSEDLCFGSQLAAI